MKSPLLLFLLLLPAALAQMERDPASTTFNWYFVMVIVAVILLIVPLIFYGRRRKAKALATQHQGHSALSEDVAMFSGPLGAEGRNGNNFRGARLGMAVGRWRASYGAREVHVEEGLDESGLPPPPYVAGDKPPSISQVCVRRGIGGESSGEDGGDAGLAVPMRTLGRDETSLRREREFEAMDDDVGDLMRPTAAQFGNERRAEEEHSS